MALCSSARSNPLAEFVKHTSDHRELQRDRLISREYGVGSTGIRGVAYNQNVQIANEFARFSESSILPMPYIEGQNLLQNGFDISVSSFPNTPRAIPWISEFEAGYANSSNALLARTQSSAHTRSSTAPISRNTSAWRLNEQTNLRGNSFRYHMSDVPSRIATTRRNEALQSIPLTQTQELSSDQALENICWEAVFESLDIAMNEATAIGPLENIQPDKEEHISRPEVTPGKEKLENSCAQILNTRLLTNYTFQDDNPFSSMMNPFNEGMQIVNNEGNLSLAALAFEAACQLDPLHLEAWKMLGSVQSENEREDVAIEALKAALNLEPDNLDVMMKLAVSYTNEGISDLAYECLETWLKAKYPHILDIDSNLDSQSPSHQHSIENIKESFIRAARYSCTDQGIDHDVQVGLGVLLFSEENYEMGADCFASAIESVTLGETNAESELHLMWNRYGACLGNMGRNEEAIEAYEMALAIRPNFVRARCNLGLIYYNTNDPIKGAKNLLQALEAYQTRNSETKKEMLKIIQVGTSHGKLEKLTCSPAPSVIYDPLKKCCNSMCRWDLAEAVGPDMDLKWFKKELDNS